MNVSYNIRFLISDFAFSKTFQFQNFSHELKNRLQENLRMFQIVEVTHLIWRQSSIDIFFIDWERPRACSSTAQSRNQPTGTVPDNLEQPVSIWRTYFVANEWNQIQTTRKTSLLFQLVLTVFVLKVRVGLVTSKWQCIEHGDTCLLMLSPGGWCGALGSG